MHTSDRHGSGAVAGGCAAPTTQLAPLPAGAVKAEQEKQRELALQDNEVQQARLDSISYPILASGTPLCRADRGTQMGFRVVTIHEYDVEMRDAAARALRLGDTLTVLSVTPGSAAAHAGLRPDDHILAIDGYNIRPGAHATKDFSGYVLESKKAGFARVDIDYERNRERQRAAVDFEPICDYSTTVVQSDELNAYSDGHAIILTSTMMRFVDDDELRVVVAHEFAHNAMGHMKAKKKNSLFGALLGALGDIAMASRGVNTGGYYASQGAKLGATAFSQDFEREADYVGLYALALAHQNLTTAPNFWRHMAQANPKSIGLAYTHPTTAERFVRMEQAIAEIDQKQETSMALRPEMKNTRRKLREPAADALAVAAPLRRTEPGQALRPVPSPTQQTALAPTSPSPRPEQEIRAGGAASAEEHAANTVVVGAASSQVGDSASNTVQGYQASSDIHDAEPGLEFAQNIAMQQSLADLKRLHVITRAEEVESPVLRLTLDDSAQLQGTPLEYRLANLYSAYRRITQWDRQTRLELWRRGIKVGEYTSVGLNLVPVPDR